jgi:glycerol kinase
VFDPFSTATEVLGTGVGESLVLIATGGVEGGVHITDVTNASRTQLMDLDTLSWDREILETVWNSARDAAKNSF